MTKILITGGTGYLGGRIVSHALEQGHDVRVLCRNQPTPGLFPSAVEIVLGNICDRDSLTKAMENCETVIHSAALVSIWQKDLHQFDLINVQGTDALLDCAFSAGIHRVVYTSSFFALGPTGEKPETESWDNTSASLPTEYARSKAKARVLVQQWVERGHDIVSVYPGIIYGPGKATQGNYITKLIADYVHRKIPGRIGKGDKRMTFSYVDDVARGHIQALEKGQPGEGYILGGEDATLCSLFEMLHDITGVTPPRITIPYMAAKGLAMVEELRSRVVPGYLPLLTRESLEVYFQHWRYSSQKAMTELGYTRLPIKIGLLNTLESLGLAREDRSTIL
jgi:NAD+-dependent farnesol dehydrogenase